MIREFKEFISKGNVMDLAVGIIIGAAFTAIVNSLVADIIMPIIGIILGGVDFSTKYVVISGDVAPGTPLAAAREAGAGIWAWGNFVTAVINFLIIAFVVFLLVKAVNRMKDAAIRRNPPPPPAPPGPTQEELLAQIRDLLAANRAAAMPGSTL